MNKYHLTISVSDENSFQPAIYEYAEGRSLIELCAQLPLLILNVERLINEKIQNESLADDDIPF